MQRNPGGFSSPRPTASAPAHWIGAFISLLEEQRSILNELERLAVRQRDLIPLEDPGPLLALMEQRQAVIDRLEASSVRIAPMRARWDEVGGADLGGEGRTARAAVEAVAMLARSIAARDAIDQDAIAARRSAISEELAQMSGGQRAVHAYAGHHGGSSRSGMAAFQDREA